MNRLKATMLCTFSLARGRIIGLLIMQIVTAFIFFQSSSVIEAYDFILDGDIFVVLYLFVFGIIYFGKHSAFCISNSVSAKYRIYSLLTVTASIGLLAALLNMAAHAFLEVKVPFSSIESFRFLVIGGVLPYNNIAATFIENIFFYISVIVTGYFLGSIRMKKGDGFTLLMLLISAAVVFGFAWLGTITVSPAAWLCILPAIMLRTRVTAILLYIIITVVYGYLIHLISNGTTNIFRRDKNENA